jgi:hypothetical protein
VVGTYDRKGEARAIANQVQGTFATMALAQVGAVDLGESPASAEGSDCMAIDTRDRVVGGRRWIRIRG